MCIADPGFRAAKRAIQARATRIPGLPTSHSRCVGCAAGRLYSSWTVGVSPTDVADTVPANPRKRLDQANDF